MRVALYPRVSGHEQKENYSIPEQIDRMKKYCDSRDWMVYKIYTDSGFSGSNTERPGLQQLIKDVESKKVDMVLVYKLDRLSRSQKDTLYLIEDVFDKNGVYFSSMTENFDTSTPFGKAMVGLLAVFAQLEREQIRERTMVGKDSRAKAGLWHGSGQIPTGYDYIDGKLVINEYEAMQVREAADLFLKLTSLRGVAKILNEKGYRRKGADWSAENVKNALNSSAVYGKIKHRDKEYDGQHKAILDEDTRQRVKEIMEKRAQEFARFYKTGQKSLLGGLLYCKHCGGKYARQKNPAGLTYYSCYSRCKSVPRMVKDPNCKNKNYRADTLDAAIIEKIKKLAVDPSYIKELQEFKPVNDADSKIQAINEEVKKIEDQISKMMDLYALGHFDLDAINSKVVSLNDTKAKLQKERDSLQGSTEEHNRLTPEQVKTTAELFSEDVDIALQRQAVQSLINYIEIDNENVLIHWNF